MVKEEKHPEYQYLDILQDIMENGSEKHDYATGISLKSIFGRQSRYDLSKGFPLLTTKKVFAKGIIHELLWFLRGDTNIKYLVDNNVHIWDEWGYKNYKKDMEKENAPKLSQEDFIQIIRNEDKDSEFVKRFGELGPVYGRMWRKWPSINGSETDQLKWAIWKTEKYPDRKHALVSSWNPDFIYEMAKTNTTMAIPPCHTLYHLNVSTDEEGVDRLSLQLYQRSCDAFLGVPFNIASYALLTQMISQVTGFEPGEFVHTYGDIHIYSNHFDQVKEQLTRTPRNFPTMKINPNRKSIDDFVFDDFNLEDYNPYPTLKAPITAVGGFDESEKGKYKDE